MNTDIHNFCDGVAHVINLPERTDRITKFTSQFDALDIGWNLEVHAAINGNTVPHPDYWQSGDGAWGCYRSHLRIIEQAVSERRNGVFIFMSLERVRKMRRRIGKNPHQNTLTTL